MNIQRKLVNQHIGFVVIMTFELIGTGLFAYTNINITNLSKETSSPILQQIYNTLFFSLSLFLCLSIGRQFSGGLYNPAVVVYRMLRIKQRFTIKIGLAYLVTQFVGAIIGAILAFWVNDLQYASIDEVYATSYQLKLMYFQAIGTFVLATMVQYVNEKKMTFLEHNRQFYLCIPMFFLISRQFSRDSSLNPALGFAFELSYCIFHGNWSILSQVYIFICGPLIGVIIAVIIFQFLLKPFYPLKRSQLQRQIQQLQKAKQQQKTKQQQHFFKRIRNMSVMKVNGLALDEDKIDYSRHKYTLHEVNSIKPEEEMYLNVDEEYKVVQDVTFHDQAESVENSDEEEGEKQMEEVSFKAFSFKNDSAKSKSINLRHSSRLAHKKISQKVMKKFKYQQN